MKKLLAVLLAAGLAACGELNNHDGTGPGDTTDPGQTGNNGNNGNNNTGTTAALLMPLSVGDTWEYQITDPVTRNKLKKVSNVVSVKQVDGVDTWVMESVTGATRSVVELQRTTDMVLRSREDEFRAGYLVETKIQKPGSVRGLLATPEAGKTFTERYDEDYMKSDGTLQKTKDMTFDWVVDAVDESVTVPAGTFKTVKLRRVRTTNAKEKVIWLAPGVGKVKEIEANGTVEELAAFNVKK
ncbi:MAG: hypothetical protein ACK4N5_23030 [Myxococcales bacterium]